MDIKLPESLTETMRELSQDQPTLNLKPALSNELSQKISGFMPVQNYLTQAQFKLETNEEFAAALTKNPNLKLD